MNIATVSAPLCLTSSLKKEQPHKKGFLFGYPIHYKKRNGIMGYSETLAGG
jgi:hypothetical protein